MILFRSLILMNSLTNMHHGEVIGIFITPTMSTPLHAIDAVRAVAGQGLEGDRYFNGGGTLAGKASQSGKPPRVDSQATFIESEALEALQREYDIELQPVESRRNILTRGVALNHLVGKMFNVGGVQMKGIKLCEPCGLLEKLTGKSVKKGLIHRGGLRAQILSDGEIRIGDCIDMVQSKQTAGASCA